MTTLWLLVTSGFAVAADNAVGETGLYVAVPTPITTEAVTRIKNRVDAARGKGDQRPSQVVFDFNPADKDAANPNHAACAELAEYIAGLSDVGTIAYVHKRATGHTVLAALACKQLAMTNDGALGEVIGPLDPPLPPRLINDYTLLVAPLHKPHAAIIQKMYDRDLVLGEGKKEAGGVWFVDLRRPAAEYEKAGVTIPDKKKVLAAAGVAKAFTADELRKYELCNQIVSDRASLASSYNITAGSLRDDPLGGRPPVAFRYTLTGEVTKGTSDSLSRVVRDIVRQKGNVLFLQLDCAGGDPQAARDLADELIKFQNPENGQDGVLIIAWIPNKAPDTAAIIALGCTDIVMSKRKESKTAEDNPATEAEFGEFEGYIGKHPDFNIDLWINALRPLAERKGVPAILLEGMIRKELSIVQARSGVNRNMTELMTEDELRDRQAKGENLQLAGVVKQKGQFLKLSATRAKEFGIAQATLDGTDTSELYTKYGVEPGKVQDATPAWLDQFSAFLKKPVVTVLLVVIGFTGLILELKVPGTTVPGIIAALCFILVFWAHTRFSGQVVVLAGLLFLMGLILILMEVFVFPGFGAAGIVGILLMLGALGLVTVDKIPESGDQWIGFGAKIAQYLFSLVGAFAIAFLAASYVRKIPILNRMTLPGIEEKDADSPFDSIPGAAKAAGLLGAIGTSATVLRPAGTVRIGDDFVDVVTEGGYIPAGTRVQVVEVEGTRIVVKEV